MVKPLHPVALFRYGILGPLVNRERLAVGELKLMLAALSEHTYQTPAGQVIRYSAKALERWYYAWRRGGVEALTPKPREDLGRTHIPADIQQCLLQAKQEKPGRSIHTLIRLLEEQGMIARRQLTRSSVHRLLKRHGLSRRTVADAPTIERRSFEALHAGDIWYGDVMHGIAVNTIKGMRKTYLVTLLDDASRLVCNSSFYLDESVTAIEHAFREALLKRGLPKKLVVDNGPAYRAKTLQTVCARLNVRLIYCRPYEPAAKGKLERWHRSVREQFLTELNTVTLSTLDELNARLWAWIEEEYHRQIHSTLKKTPLDRYREDLAVVQPLGELALNLDDYFDHRVKRTVRKDGTVSFEGQFYEVPHRLVGQSIYLVVDPYCHRIKGIESLKYEKLGEVHRLDKQANNHRRRQRPVEARQTTEAAKNSLVETLYQNNLDLWDATQMSKREETV